MTLVINLTLILKINIYTIVFKVETDNENKLKIILTKLLIKIPHNLFLIYMLFCVSLFKI